MASLVQKLAAQTLKTFKIPRRNPEFHQNLMKLKEYASSISKQDVNFDERLVENQEKFHPSRDGAPVTYVHIWEDNLFTMGIFVLKNGSRLPLHDHPDMHGVIKVLHGKLSVKSYSTTPNAPSSMDTDDMLNRQGDSSQLTLRAKLTTETVIDAESEPCVLYPEDNNLHEIHSVGPSAFLDILSPPYDHDQGDRVCRYYEASKDSAIGGEADGTCLLKQVSQPFDFWCTGAEYNGPDPDPYNDIN